MRSLIKNMLREGLLREKKVNVSDLPSSVILIRKNLVKSKVLTLYDTSEIKSSNPLRGVLGYTHIRDYSKDMSVVGSVAAVKGYGPLMYELAAQASRPKPLASDREADTRDSAVNVWLRFINGNNPNIEIVELSPEDEGYEECVYFGCVESEPEFMKMFNSRLYAKNDVEYNALIKRGNKFLGKAGEDYIDTITEYGHRFFDNMYN